MLLLVVNDFPLSLTEMVKYKHKHSTPFTSFNHWVLLDNKVLKCFILKEHTIENTQRTLASIFYRLGVNITKIYTKGQNFFAFI